MLRREIVLLVSRAIALLLAIPASISFVLSIPTQFMLLYMRNPAQHFGISQPPFDFFYRFALPALLTSLFGVLLHLFAAAFFWHCGPWIERMLLPTGSEYTTDAP